MNVFGAILLLITGVVIFLFGIIVGTTSTMAHHNIKFENKKNK